MKKAFIITAFIIVTILTWYAGVCQLIYSFERFSYDKKSDAAIVLGAAVWDSVPSPVFRERINHAINLYKRGRVKNIIFTGGVGQGKIISEGRAGRNYAIKFGIDSSDLFFEERSKVTYTNLLFAREILQNNNLKTALIVSDPLHMKRAHDICRKLNIQALPSPTPTSLFKSRKTRTEFLLYEAYYYTFDFLGGHLKLSLDQGFIF